MSELVARLRDEHPKGAAVLLAVVAVAAGLAWYRAGLSSGGADVAGALPPPVEAPASSSSTITTAVVVVHVAGAVVRPGLYRLAAGSRVADAIELAGGPRPRADLDRLNLAARLVDGQRVAVSRRGEPVPPGPVDSGPAADGGTSPAGPVDLNTAGTVELETLPGVGPATARKILEERSRRGGFRSVRDLLGVAGIGERRFAELRDRVRV
ncbi:MAG TPA: helix-hairpin-helix domain-containing protein [Acidimicrobiia bacterium]|jgi:competence protein ComEA